MIHYGPTLKFSQEIHAAKHRQAGESFEEAMKRIAHALADDAEHEAALLEILLDMRFLPAGRVQAAVGAERAVTAYNCFVSGVIPDSMEGIMQMLTEAAFTMKMGGGIGYNFSTIRPRGTLINSLMSSATGPVSFMEPFDATCGTISSAGHRRGAQMGTVRIDHPDIELFIDAKCNDTELKRFNISVGVTDVFMQAVMDDTDFHLVWGGEVYRTIRARDLWDKLMWATWDWAEPGILFIDRINDMNNLYYCETITTTNPCGEQPLPPYGACLLGSFNWVRYIVDVDQQEGSVFSSERLFDIEQMLLDIPVIVRAMDNVVDRTLYPLPQQEAEAKAKRRMGLGVTGMANAIEALGFPYASEEAIKFTDGIMEDVTNAMYVASAELACEKGSFPLYDQSKYMAGKFVATLRPETREVMLAFGMRNSHLTSMAPTGSISLYADNISSGIEPVFSYGYDRTYQEFDGEKIERVDDYGVRVFGVRGRTADQLSPSEHVDVLIGMQKWTDSACSKTCNIGDDVTFEEFSDVYVRAWKGGAKGCTTFRAAGKRYGILNVIKEDVEEAVVIQDNWFKRKWLHFKELWHDTFDEPMDVVSRIEAYEEAEVAGAACYIDRATGKKTCD